MLTVFISVVCVHIVFFYVLKSNIRITIQYVKKDKFLVKFILMK